MATSSTSKSLDLTQLHAALGVTSIRLFGAAAESEDEKTVEADVDQATLEAAIATNSYTPPVWMLKKDWRARFTDEEYIAISESRNRQVIQLRDELSDAADPINIKAPRFQGGIQILATVDRENEPGVKLIAAHRPEELLSNPTP